MTSYMTGAIEKIETGYDGYFDFIVFKKKSRYCYSETSYVVKSILYTSKVMVTSNFMFVCRAGMLYTKYQFIKTVKSP